MTAPNRLALFVCVPSVLALDASKSADWRQWMRNCACV